MEDFNFESLAPRFGLKPMYSDWSDIGTSQLNGGAINWGSMWSGLKNFGSHIKNYTNKALNSQTAQLVKQKLKDSNIADKIAEGIATGIHGAVDIAQQRLEDEVQKRLRKRPTPDALREDEQMDISAPDSRLLNDNVTFPQSTFEKLPEKLNEKDVLMVDLPNKLRKRAIEEYEQTTTTSPSRTSMLSDSPPAYTDLFPTSSSKSASYSTPRSNWEKTLGDIVGLGFRSIKKQKCF